MEFAFTTPLSVRPSTTSTLFRPTNICTLRTSTFLPTTTANANIFKGANIHENKHDANNDTSTTTTTMKIFDWKKRSDPNFAVLSTEDEGIFKVNNLRPAPGSRKRKKRKGRGDASGGASCGFGMRGQKSRSGRSVRPGFEGGQTPLYRRIPKFVGRPMGPGHKRTEYAIIKPEFLNQCPENSVVTFQSLRESAVITKQKRKIVKVLGGSPITVKGLTVKAHAFTSSAVQAIEEANGKCVLISPTTGKDLIFDEEEDEDNNQTVDAESESESESGSESESEEESS